VIGILRGDVEPDRFVLVGNHRDAWGFGSIDPSSGTAQMSEVVRVLGQKVATGWRPRRTIVFLSWGAEEYGLIGAREFVEDFLPTLEDRSVAYVNVDSCPTGNVLWPGWTPTLKQTVVEATKAIPDPTHPERTYYEFWSQWIEDEGLSEEDLITSTLPGAGSDHSPFMFYLGIPAVDLNFNFDYHADPTLKDIAYPTYHTGYETFELVNNTVDRDFSMHATCSRLSLAVVRDLSDRVVLNLVPLEYAKLLRSAWAQLEADEALAQIEGLGISTEALGAQIERFAVAVTNWTTLFSSLDASSDPLLARALNDQMMGLDRAFLLTHGLPNRPQYRHSIISPSQFNAYGGGAFPGIRDLLYHIENETGDVADLTRQLRRHVSDVLVAVKQASDFLAETWRVG
jgi:hypothetical protein